LNAIRAARHPQTFFGISGDGVASAVTTSGNPDCHLVLRGGDQGPNYSAEHVAEAVRQLGEAGLDRAVVIDCSHDNSGKDPARHSIIGAMLESNLVEGNQPLGPSTASLVYGQSITDACIDWETTERLVLEVADKRPETST
jgi:3-deoxy-7-phosphoheptulonate synthase